MPRFARWTPRPPSCPPLKPRPRSPAPQPMARPWSGAPPQVSQASRTPPCRWPRPSFWVFLSRQQGRYRPHRGKSVAPLEGIARPRAANGECPGCLLLLEGAAPATWCGRLRRTMGFDAAGLDRSAAAVTCGDIRVSRRICPGGICPGGIWASTASGPRRQPRPQPRTTRAWCALPSTPVGKAR